MPARIELLRVDSFTGGLNLRADAFQLAANESPDLLNMDVDPRGGFSSRGGFNQLNTTAVGGVSTWSTYPQQLFNWTRPTPQLMLSVNNKVYFTTTSSFTDTTIATTAADGASFAPWSGTAALLYVATGNGGQGAKWDGATKTLLTASGTGQWQESLATPTGTHMPKANLAASHVDRMWVANTVEDAGTFPDRVRFSHPLFPESWRSADFIDVIGGGSGITAIVPFRGSLIVFKRHSIWAIYGYDTDTWQVSLLTDQLGALSSKHVVATEGRIYFFSWPDGLFSFDGNGFQDLFIPLRPLITLAQINEGQLAKISVAFVNRRVWLSLPQGSSTNPTYSYVLDPTISQAGAWTRYQSSDGFGMGVGCDFVGSTGVRTPVCAHPTKSFVLKVDQLALTQDNPDGVAANFSSYYVTKWQDAGLIAARKMWRRPDFVAKQSSGAVTLTIQVFRDWAESKIVRTSTLLLSGTTTGLLWAATAAEPDANPGWNQAPWGAAPTGARWARGGNLGLARSVQLKIAGPGGLAWGIDSITFKYNPRKIRA